MEHFDVIVIGAGPAGERAAITAAKAGRRAALIERAPQVGGTRINWGTIPSKTLRESALFVLGLTANKLDAIQSSIADEITVADFMHRERMAVQRELELITRSLAGYDVRLVRGHGRLLDAHTVGVSDPDGKETARLRGDFIVLATGSSPNRPPDVPFDGDVVFDSTTVLQMPRMPRSMIVLGAGVIGIEYASIFAALRIRVMLVDTRDRLLPYADREVVGILEDQLTSLGLLIQHGDTYRIIRKRAGDPPAVHCLLRSGRELEADVLLYCVGRDGNTATLGLEAVGIRPDRRGLLAVNEHYQTALPHIYAVGDVIGYPALASTAMEQGRQAMRHALGIPGPKLRTAELPLAVYAIPEISYIGETEESLQKKGVRYVVGRGLYALNPRGMILGQTGGVLKLLFEADSLRLVGAHIVGHGASELIHIGQAFLANGADARQIAETLFNYPTLSDLYRHAGLEALKAAASPA
jgi:NAD(P) transhydrogenase